LLKRETTGKNGFGTPSARNKRKRPGLDYPKRAVGLVGCNFQSKNKSLKKERKKKENVGPSRKKKGNPPKPPSSGPKKAQGYCKKCQTRGKPEREVQEIQEGRKDDQTAGGGKNTTAKRLNSKQGRGRKKARENRTRGR